MNSATKHHVATALADASRGDAAAAAGLAPLVYDELRALARRRLRAGDRDALLQTTALLHETYARLLGATHVEWEGRVHFYAVAARAMRRVLANHARDMRAQKRGGGARRVELVEGAASAAGAPSLDLLELDDALRDLAALDERQHEIVTLRALGGLTAEQTALALGVSQSTVQREWRAARAWLSARLGRGATP